MSQYLKLDPGSDSLDLGYLGWSAQVETIARPSLLPRHIKLLRMKIWEPWKHIFCIVHQIRFGNPNRIANAMLSASPACPLSTNILAEISLKSCADYVTRHGLIYGSKALVLSPEPQSSRPFRITEHTDHRLH